MRKVDEERSRKGRFDRFHKSKNCIALSNSAPAKNVPRCKHNVVHTTYSSLCFVGQVTLLAWVELEAVVASSLDVTISMRSQLNGPRI